MSRLDLMPSVVKGTVVLRGAGLGTLSVGSDPWAEASATATVDADGWAPGRVEGWLRKPKKARDWLDRLPDPERDFSPQPWHALADEYEGRGHPAEAKKLRVGAAWRVTKRAPWPARIGRGLYGDVVGWGYRPLPSLG